MNKAVACRQVLVVLFLLFALAHSNAKTNTQKTHSIDSLVLALKKLPDDTSQLAIMDLLGTALLTDGQYSKALDLSRQMRATALRLNYSLGVGKSWLLTGNSYHKLNKNDSALISLSNAWAIFKTTENKQYKATTYLNIGQIYDELGNYKMALDHYKKVIEFTTNTNYHLLIARTLNSIGNTYFKKGSYEIAVNYYLQSYNTADYHKLNFNAQLNNLGVIYALLGQMEEALKYFTLYHSTIKNKTDYKIEQASVLLNMGECYFKLGKYQQAHIHLQQATALQLELNDRRGLALSYSILGDTYVSNRQLDLAKQHYEKAEQLAREIKNDEVLLNPLIGLTNLYIKRQKIAQAEQTIQEAWTISERLQSKHNEEMTLRLLARVDSLKGNQAGYAKWLHKYIQLHDSLFNEQKSRLVIRMSELYETEKKENEIKLLSEARKFEDLKRTSERSLFFISITFLVLVVVSIGYWAFTQNRHSRILKSQNLAIAQAHAELSNLLEKIEHQNTALASKNEILEELHHEKDGLIGIVAHDLRSPLNRIEGLSNLLPHMGTLAPEQEEVIQTIKKVCRNGNDLIRDLLDINQYETVKTLKLVDTEVTQFIAEQLNHYLPSINHKHLTLHYDFDKTKRATMQTDRECLVRIIDNLLTNAIKFSPQGKNIYLSTHFFGSEQIQLRVRDEGPGFQPEDVPHLFKKFKKLSARPTGGESSTGLGLSIVKSLVERLQGTIQLNNIPGKGAEFVLTFKANVYSTRNVDTAAAAVI